VLCPESVVLHRYYSKHSSASIHSQLITQRRGKREHCQLSIHITIPIKRNSKANPKTEVEALLSGKFYHMDTDISPHTYRHFI